MASLATMVMVVTFAVLTLGMSLKLQLKDPDPLSSAIQNTMVSKATTMSASYTFNSAVGTLPPETYTSSRSHSSKKESNHQGLVLTLRQPTESRNDNKPSAFLNALLFRPEGKLTTETRSDSDLPLANNRISQDQLVISNSKSFHSGSGADFWNNLNIPETVVSSDNSSGSDLSAEDVFAAADVQNQLARKRPRREAKVGDIMDTIKPQYCLTIHVHNVEASSNRSIDTTILRLKMALGAELDWPVTQIHVEKINFAGSKIDFYLENEFGQLVLVRDLVTPDLLPRLSARVPDLGLTDVSEEVNLSTTSSRVKKLFWTLPYFPYVLAGSSVAVLLALSILIYCCCCIPNTKTQKQSSDHIITHRSYTDNVDNAENGVVGTQTIFYPSLKPELASPVTIQPDPSEDVPAYVPSYSPPYPNSYASSAYTTCGPLVAPVPTQPIRVKAKGLLERRGSNASLTLDLNATPEMSRWEGTPPKESSALEFLLSAGNRLSRRDLRNAVRHTKILYEEFWEIPMNHTEKVAVAGSGMKNRYKTIIPNEHSRVLLPDIDNDPLNSYINANYIRGYEGESRAYIATQGPMAHTVMDFWRMIWQEKCPIIVMITKLKEKSKTKCENYLPEKWGVFGEVEVVIDSIIPKRGYILRHITLRYNGESRSILHYWYTSWPDHKPPDSPHMLLDLIKEVELRRCSTSDLGPTGPVCVHCSAGIGRTGCFIAISIGIRQLREEHSVDTLGIVCAIRVDRGGMIQTHEQYDFVHQALAVYERELGEPSVQSITALTTESVTTPP